MKSFIIIVLSINKPNKPLKSSIFHFIDWLNKFRFFQSQHTMLRLKCAVQNYEWGKRGDSSMVAQLMPKTEKIDENKPYAEVCFFKII